MRTIHIITSIILTVGLTAAFACAQGFGPGDGTGECRFIDEDGDGFNDLAPDADGDGIPNGLDPDFVRPEDGSGPAHQWSRQDAALLASSVFGFGPVIMDSEGAIAHTSGPGDGSGFGGDDNGMGFGPGSGSGDADGDGSSADPTQNENRGHRRGGGR